MSTADATSPSMRPGAKALVLGVVLAALAAVVGYAALHEMQKAQPVAARADQSNDQHAFADRRPARSAAEERFAQALWNQHAEVRTSAVRMTFAGLAYKMGDGGTVDLRNKVVPLIAVFRNAEAELRAIEAPASMQALRDRYGTALKLYADSAGEMIRIADDNREEHLLKAQEMSEEAAGALLEVSDELWPGEIKPN